MNASMRDNCPGRYLPLHARRVRLAAVTTIVATAVHAVTATVPEVKDVAMAQDNSRLVTISYTLSDVPAVVTVDVQTNATVNGETVWASIGGANIQQMAGDVWRRVEPGARTVLWRPDLSWPDHRIADGGARAVVTAWALDNTPDYMVVDISAAAHPGTQRYYPAADFLPGGLLANPDYRTTKLVMRKVMAKGVAWTMGSTVMEMQRWAVREATHPVVLTNNYYVGVFPVTQAQWGLVQPAFPAPSYFNNAADRAMRPVEQVCYNEIRNSANSTAADPAFDWPNDPNPGSFLGLLRARTGLDFDLPSEAQWEFAARAGNGDTRWGDGSGILNADTDANLDILGRYAYNGGMVPQDGGSGHTPPPQSCGAANGTAPVGSYAPNAWGLYDTAGNVWEWCLDWFVPDISAHEGAVNADPSTPANTLSGVPGATRVKRGGCWDYTAGYCRPAFRHDLAPDTRYRNIGFRVLCSAGLR